MIYPLETLFPHELEARLAQQPVLVLPFGTVEWHSLHLPLGLDGLVAQAVSRQIADAMDAVLAPVTWFATSGIAFPFTLNLPIEVIEPLLSAALSQFAAMGFRLIIPFSGHFSIEQVLTIKRSALHLMERAPATVLPLTNYELITDLWMGDHAGAGETALMMALRPDLVRMQALDGVPQPPGIVGTDPRPIATPEWGQMLLKTIVARSVEVGGRLLHQTDPVALIEYREALRAAVRVLERSARERVEKPKSAVPALMTASYLACLRAIYAGDYAAAKGYAERKLLDLAQ